MRFCSTLARWLLIAGGDTSSQLMVTVGIVVSVGQLYLLVSSGGTEYSEERIVQSDGCGSETQGELEMGA